MLSDLTGVLNITASVPSVWVFVGFGGHGELFSGKHKDLVKGPVCGLFFEHLDRNAI